MDIEYLSPNEFIAKIVDIPIVHAAKVLYEDFPNEISIRIEMLQNTAKMDRDIVDNSMHELSYLMSVYRIENCKEIDLTIVYREVIK